ncbi:hypothetical protein HZC33_01275 [Candidatus Wolfebacteria bacterium]|nr:hypothetical protein [Candidatus Wolfebacteria bacterium]
MLNIAQAASQIPDISQYGGPKAVGPTNVGGIVDILVKVMQWTYSIFFVVAVLFIILAAYEYLTGAEDPERIREAHKRIIWAGVAIAVAILALSFNLLVQNFLGASGGGGGSSGGGAGGTNYSGGGTP